MATLTDWLAAIKAHAVAAGATLSNPITDVAVGWPIPKGRCCRIYWDGEAVPPRFGEGYTGNSQLIAHKITATWFWPVSDPGERNAEARVTEMADVTDEMRTRVLGDDDLADECESLSMDFATPDLGQWGTSLFAFVAHEFTIDYQEYPVAR